MILRTVQARSRRRSGRRAVLAIALPVMASNVSEPLIGLADTWVVGRLPEPHYIGAVALGAMVLSFIFWGFGFLRMGTGGLAAQAVGARDAPEIRAVLGRALLIGVVAGLGLIAFSPLIDALAFSLLDGSAEVEAHARAYFQIRILSAPFALANYAFLGWFIGLGKARTALILQLLLNLSNVAFDLLFVLHFGMTADGVALGALLASVIAAGGGAWAARLELRRRGGGRAPKRILDPARLKRTFAVNFDIMVRTMAVLFAFALFTAKSAESGDVTLAANTVLMNVMVFGTYLIDGFAHAAEALSGRAVGAGSRSRFMFYALTSSRWALLVSVGLALVTWLLGPFLIDALSVNPEVRETARLHLLWIVAAPVLGVGCYQLDGIFIGATQTRDLRNMMLLSVLLHLAAWHLLTGLFGNHGLWAGLMVFLVVRALTLLARMPALVRERFPQPA